MSLIPTDGSDIRRMFDDVGGRKNVVLWIED
jgi:hypothetical protein